MFIYATSDFIEGWGTALEKNRKKERKKERKDPV